MKSFILFLSVTLLIGAPMLAGAQAEIPAPSQTILASGPTGVIDLLRTITNWLFTILLLVAVIFIILAAYKYLFSGGGEEVGKAHKMLLYAAIAIAVAFLAKGIVYVVGELVTSGSSSSNRNNGGLQVQYNSDNFGVRVNL